MCFPFSIPLSETPQSCNIHALLGSSFGANEKCQTHVHPPSVHRSGLSLHLKTRPIAVLQVIYKWYGRCLGALCGAFTHGRQAEEALFTIRQLIDKTSLCTLDTDVAMAYDHVSFDLVEKRPSQKRSASRPYRRVVTGMVPDEVYDETE